MTRIKTSPHSIQRGIQLRVLREQLGFDQDQAGALIHRSDTVISFLENGGQVQVEKYGDALEREYKMLLGQQSSDADPLFRRTYNPPIEEPVASEPDPEPEDGLVRVDFQGDTLTAIERDGKVWVSVRRVCEALGINFAAQSREIQQDQALCSVVAHQATTAKDGKNYNTLLISTKGLMLWLAGISTSRVSPHAAQKLTAYKLECAEVLERHFFAKHQAHHSPSSASPFDLNHPVFASLAQTAALLGGKIGEFGAELVSVKQQVEQQSKAVEDVAVEVGRIKEALQKDAEQRQQIAMDLRFGGISEPTQLPPPRTLRSSLSMRVRGWAFQRGGGEAYKETWDRLYREFRDRYHHDIVARAKNRNNMDKLDYAEREGLIESLYNLACFLFPIEDRERPSATHADF